MDVLNAAYTCKCMPQQQHTKWWCIICFNKNKLDKMSKLMEGLHQYVPTLAGRHAHHTQWSLTNFRQYNLLRNFVQWWSAHGSMCSWGSEFTPWPWQCRLEGLVSVLAYRNDPHGEKFQRDLDTVHTYGSNGLTLLLLPRLHCTLV